MRTNHFLLVAIILTCLSACSGGPRQDPTPSADAIHDIRVLRVAVVKVFDNRTRDYTSDFHISHVVDVDVLDGPGDVSGQHLTLPYDEFNVGQPPPHAGDVVTMTPADWLSRNRDRQMQRMLDRKP